MSETNLIYFVYGLLFAAFIFLGMYVLIQMERGRATKRENEMIKRLAEELEKRKEKWKN